MGKRKPQQDCRYLFPDYFYVSDNLTTIANSIAIAMASYVQPFLINTHHVIMAYP